MCTNEIVFVCTGFFSFNIEKKWTQHFGAVKRIFTKVKLNNTKEIMAKSIDISAPASFNIHEDPTNLGATWKKWKTKFGVYLTAANITDDNQSKALLLHCGRLQRFS